MDSEPVLDHMTTGHRKVYDSSNRERFVFGEGSVEKVRKKCPHVRRKTHCMECKGSSICVHDKVKTQCRNCQGSAICVHNKRKTVCRDCQGSAFCVHGKRNCRDCKSVAFCVHDKLKTQCRNCQGSAICVHNKRKTVCRDCQGSAFCVHDKLKARCRDCQGVAICVHDKMKIRCIQCGGSQICPHCKTLPFASTLARVGQHKYDGYCATCFKHLFPDDERSKLNHEHTKELAVRQAINLEFEGFAHDKQLETSHCDCTMRRRIDCRKTIGGTLLGVECDENAHLRYDQEDEKARYHDIFMGHGGKMVFIRFNPDLKGIPLEHKLSVLIQEIYKQIARIERCENSELLEVVYLFYPE